MNLNLKSRYKRVAESYSQIILNLVSVLLRPKPRNKIDFKKFLLNFIRKMMITLVVMALIGSALANAGQQQQFAANEQGIPAEHMIESSEQRNSDKIKRKITLSEVNWKHTRSFIDL